MFLVLSCIQLHSVTKNLKIFYEYFELKFVRLNEEKRF